MVTYTVYIAGLCTVLPHINPNIMYMLKNVKILLDKVGEIIYNTLIVFREKLYGKWKFDDYRRPGGLLKSNPQDYL